MFRKLVLILACQVVLSLAISACSSAESTAPREDISAPPEASRVETPDAEVKAGPPTDVVSQLIRSALQSDGSLTYEGLVQRLGVPRRVEAEPISNQYVDGQVDTLRTLVYPGLKALVYDVAGNGKTFLVRLSLSSTRYTTPTGLRVGLSADRVIEKLGAPTRRDDSAGELIYQETESKPTSMVVHVQNGRVVAINWEFYFA